MKTPQPATFREMLELFEREHDDALVELDRLEHAAIALEDGQPADSHLGTVREVHGALTTTIKQHNEHEEAWLFPELGNDAPTSVFIEEHEILRGLEQQLGRAYDGPTPARDIPPVAHEVVALLRAHIERENTMLFPWAREQLGSEGLARLSE